MGFQWEFSMFQWEFMVYPVPLQHPQQEFGEYPLSPWCSSRKLECIPHVTVGFQWEFKVYLVSLWGSSRNSGYTGGHHGANLMGVWGVPDVSCSVLNGNSGCTQCHAMFQWQFRMYQVSLWYSDENLECAWGHHDVPAAIQSVPGVTMGF